MYCFTTVYIYYTDTHNYYHVWVEIIRLLPLSKSYTYLLAAIDHFAHWPEAVPILDISSERVVQP